ncbi:MAG TPA: hypothetical protein PKW68_05805, partial [bacterium]|nr:hypothetical protein [bacterium]
MNRKAFALSTSFLALAILLLLFPITSCNRGGADELFRKAEADLGVGKIGSALRIYDEMLSDFPNDPARPKIFFKIAELYEIFL